MKLRMVIKDPLDAELRQLPKSKLCEALIPLVEAVLVDLKNGRLNGQWLTLKPAHWNLVTLEQE